MLNIMPTTTANMPQFVFNDFIAKITACYALYCYMLQYLIFDLLCSILSLYMSTFEPNLYQVGKITISQRFYEDHFMIMLRSTCQQINRY